MTNCVDVEKRDAKIGIVTIKVREAATGEDRETHVMIQKRSKDLSIHVNRI